MARNLDDFARNLDEAIRQLKTIPQMAGREAVNHYKRSFREQGFTDSTYSKWQDRKKADKSKTKKGSRAILVQSGALRRSIDYKVSGNRVTVFSDVPYAQVHNEGLQVSGVRSVKSHSRKTKKGKVTVKAHSRNVNFRMTKRQFMDIPNTPISAVLQGKIIDKIEGILEKLGK